MWTSAANPALRELVANESEFAEAFFHPLECPVQYPDHSPVRQRSSHIRQARMTINIWFLFALEGNGLASHNATFNDEVRRSC
jgi:hypothetical protein